MNQDQLISLVRSLLKVAGAALVSHGATKAGSFVNAEDTIGLAITIAGFVWSHWQHSDGAAPATPPKVGLVMLALSLSFFAPGCTWFSGKTAQLQQGGAYSPIDLSTQTNSDGTISIVTNVIRAPDFAFFAADSAFDLAYSAVDGAMNFEMKNRAWLFSISPNVKHSLDAVRPKVWKVVSDYTAARAAYMANPTPEGLATIQGLSASLKTIADMIVAVVAQNVAPPATAKSVGVALPKSGANINQ